jgi:hypothetical protein
MHEREESKEKQHTFLGVLGHNGIIVGEEVLQNSNHVQTTEALKRTGTELIQSDKALALSNTRVELADVAVE